MAIDPEIAEVLRRTEAGGWIPLTGSDVDHARRSYRALSLIRRGDGYAPVEVAEVDDVSLPGPAGPLAARVYAPAEPIDAVVVFLHGGGWVIGDLDTHDPLARLLAAGTRATVVSLEYRLAPEAPYPGPLDDAMAALRWATDRWPGRRLAVAGDSAGGGLAAGAALRARDEPGGPSLSAQLLVYPALDPSLSRPSVAENGEGNFLTAADMTWFWDHYLAGGSIDRDGYVDPLGNPDLAGLPPAVVALAEFDPLRDEGADYGVRLADAGVGVTVLPGDGLVHGFMGMVELSAAAAREGDALVAAFAPLLF